MTVPWRLAVQDSRAESVYVAEDLVGRKREQCSGRRMTTWAAVSDQSLGVWHTE